MSDGAVIPVFIVTGFLGAGKTTFLNALLRAPEMAASLVVINEWGDVGLDHLLVEKVDGDVILLGSGCVCCALRGDLVDALRSCLERRDSGATPPFERIVVETTGLADPAPVVQAIIGDGHLATRLRLAGVVTLVDALDGAATIIRHGVSARQIAAADVLAISKSDLIEAGARDQDMRDLSARLRATNPLAPILLANAFGLATLLDLEGLILSRREPEGHPVQHNAWIKTRALRLSEPVGPASFAAFIELLSALLGPNMLRIKGLIALADDPDRPLVLQGAGHSIDASRRLDRWPDADRATRIVLIFEGVPSVAIDRLWHALTRSPEIDAPDLAALTQSPLSPLLGGLMG